MAREMKDSGIEWIGEIPIDWEISKLKYVTKFCPTCDRTNIFENSFITYLPMEYIKNGKYILNIKEYGQISSTLTEFQEGDIVMAKVTPCFENGNIAIMENIVSGYGLGSSELFVYRPMCIERRYLFYWLRNSDFINRGCSTMTGTGGLKRVNPYFAKNCEIHMPPLYVQKSIANFLDEKCSAIDSAIAKTAESIEAYKKLKQAVITKAVTKGIRGDRPMKDSGIEWIGEIPADWEIIKITRMLDYTNKYPLGDGDHGLIKTDDYMDEGIPYIRVQNLGWGTELNLDNVVYISKEKNSLIKTSILKPNDILFAKTGATIGKTAIIPDTIPISNTTSHVGKITLEEKYYPRFVFYYLSSSIGYKQLWDIAILKTTRPELSIDEMRNIKIITASSKQEQQEIADYLDQKCTEIDNIITKKQQLITKLEAYKKSLIYEYVTGKKEVQ